MKEVVTVQRDLGSAESLVLRTKYANVLEYIVLSTFLLSTGTAVLFTQVHSYLVLILSTMLRASTARIQVPSTFLQYKVFVLVLHVLVLVQSLPSSVKKNRHLAFTTLTILPIDLSLLV